MRRGRRSKEVDPDKLEEAVARGLFLKAAAAELGIHARTLFRRLAADPELRRRVDRGRRRSVMSVERKLMQQIQAGDRRAMRRFCLLKLARLEPIDTLAELIEQIQAERATAAAAQARRG